jgi:transposase
MRYKEGLNRNQSLMFPELLDDYVDENNPVRFIDAFIDGLDLLDLGFTHAITSTIGCKPYNPATLLKLYVYGYLNKVRSSRRLEKSTYCNVEVMWLLGKLRPDFKTIADFRKNNVKALKKVFREFVLLCKSMDLFGCELIAIDGSKFSAVNHNDRNYTKDKLKKLLKEINEKIDNYLAQLDQTDQQETDVNQLTTTELQQKIEHLKERKTTLKLIQKQMDESGENQLSQTDSDSRMMKSNNRSDVCYNVQITTDDKHKLILDFDVTNEINDLNQLSPMAIEAKNILGVDELNATTDTGYHNEVEIAKCEKENITCYIPKAKPKSKEDNSLYTKADFEYDSKNDYYICPAKQLLTYKKNVTHANKKEQKKYGYTNCKACSLRPQCMGDKGGNRYIFRGIHEDLIDQMEQRVKANPQIVNKRKAIVEHPFGYIKHWMDQSYFLMRGFEKVTAEMSLSALCFDMKRVLNIFNVKELIAIIAQS